MWQVGVGLVSVNEIRSGELAIYKRCSSLNVVDDLTEGNVKPFTASIFS